jgi:diadenosine tetraphosphate (Ap4A) HIT family hydrolase
MRDGCPFCDYDGPSQVLYEGSVMTGNEVVGFDLHPYFVIEPLDPVTEGHLLVIPRKHTADFRDNPRMLGALMQAAADYAASYTKARRGEVFTPGCNLIVSAGAEATQTVPHVHVHVVPRREGDGLRLPWSA